MKTNKILMAVALPALLAACTAEEVVEQSSVANLSNRALLSQDFSVGVTEGVDSRFAWEGLIWKWEAGDQFGAGVVDPAVYGEVSNSSMLGNYIFVKDGEKYKTDSQMSEGTYMFYSYDGFKTKSSRSLVSFDISSQKTDMNDPEAMINDYANQLMFSPLFDIEAEYSKEKLPLEFRSFWGVAAFKFKNNSGQTLKINQIVLKEADSNKSFVVKGGINPKAINDAGLKYVYNEKGAKYNGTEGEANENNYVPVSVNNLINDKTLTEAKRLEKIEDAYEAFEKAYYNTALSKDVTGNGSSSFIAMNCQNYKMKHGETVTAYMLVPEHKGGNLSVEIMVVDEEDESWSIFVEDETIDSNYGMEDSKEVEGLDELAILRHKTNAIFGKTTDGKGMKTLSITEDDLQENSGYYIDNNEALIDLINANLGKILVHNTGDTYINAEVIKAIKEYTGTHVTFSNAIEIKDAEALVDDADTETELALTQITFNGGAVVKGESEKNKIDGTVEFGKDIVFGAGQTLTIEEGANVTLNKGAYKNIKNSGNLTIVGAEDNGSRAVDTYNGKVTNLAGTLTLKGTTPVVDMKAGSLNYVALNRKTLVVNSEDLTIAAGVELTVGEYVTLEMKNDMAVANLWKADGKDVLDYSTWTNNGEIEIAVGKVFDIEGTLNNNGKINGGKIHVLNVDKYTLDSFFTAGTFNNNGDAVVDAEEILVEEETVVNNYGDFLAETVKNNGTIVLKDQKAHVNVTAGKGEIDNTVNGVIEELPATGMLVYARVGAMTDGKELSEFDDNSEINKLYVTGRWTITKEPKSGEEVAANLSGIEVIEFTTKDAMYLRQGATLDLSNVKIKVSGVDKVVFTGYNDNKLTIGEIEYGSWWNSNDGTSGAWNQTEVEYKHIDVTQSGATLENGGDVDLDATIKVESSLNITKDTEIDLNGYDVVFEGAKATDAVLNANGAELVVTGEGDIEGAILAKASEGGVLVIEGGNWIGHVRTQYGLVRAEGETSEVLINGGYFEYDYEVDNANDYEMILNGEGKSEGIIVKKGVFKNYNPAKANSKYKVSLAKGSKVRVMKGNENVTEKYANMQWDFAKDGDLIYIVE